MAVGRAATGMAQTLSSVQAPMSSMSLIRTKRVVTRKARVLPLAMKAVAQTLVEMLVVAQVVEET